ncbi:T9SS type A sorting domain-containing protein [Gillisia sp. M10.2A]|uniref:T9SS type A sorting domain-containing protein n=1 Tax=Gillisia lutea TaxID=2909668 RepID=A0ABS9EI53_9FLAO|nr:T9SS type A sorting domain-containing protein [Gillisia lutea]MCF4101534.1 T9SS type A sorting domain-containing protein [Gillisia lutea]
MRFNKIIPYFILLPLMFLFTDTLSGQSINNITLSSNSVCAGSNIDISFSIRNGTGPNNRFNANTEFNIYLYRYANGNYAFYGIIDSFQSSSYPIGNNNALNINRSNIPVPNNLPQNNDYFVLIISSNPDAYDFTNYFEVKSRPATPTLSNNGPICVGGTLNLSASSISGATYRWNGPNGYTSTQQNPSRTNVTTAMAGTYTVVATVNGCTSTASSTNVVIQPASTTYNQTESGNNSWIGHVYDNVNFTNYLGGYTEARSFDQSFGGNQNNFRLGTTSCSPTVYTETFSVRYRMTSNLKGLYYTTIGADDGNRLSIDGTEIYNDWNDHAYRENSNILLNLNGASNLVLDYYENGGGNRISFANLMPLVENTLSQNTNQNLCSGSNATAISGDQINTLPNGINRVGTGYQWVYSNTVNGPRTNINGATAATFTPNTNATPFNQAGTYYIYRQVKLSSSNNTGNNPYVTTHESNAATVVVTTGPTATLSGTTTICEGESTDITATFTGVGPWTISGTINSTPYSYNVNQNPYTLSVNPTTSTTYRITSISDSRNCTNNSVNTSATVTVNNNVINNSISQNQNLCQGTAIQQLTGSVPSGGNGTFSYLWESSVTSATSGFNAAPGNNSTINYTPGNITQTTWFRRRVTSSTCGASTSNVVTITINSALANNNISFVNGNSGKLCAVADENATLNLSAPVGTVFTYVNFASYGTPNGNCNAFTYSACHANDSQSISESYLLNNTTVSIPATNGIFGDPCQGTYKKLAVEATYSQPICVGTNPGVILGTTPSGGDSNFTYLWQISSTGPNSGFTNAPGTNNTKDYSPGELSQTIWLRRTVSSGGCSSTSPVLLIPVKTDNVWTGATSTNWNTTSNWACNTLPTLNTNVVINGGLTNYPILNNGVTGKSKSIDIAAGASVIVVDNTLEIAGAITNAGSFNVERGGIELKGNVLQQIPAGIFTNNRIKNIAVNNSSNGQLQGPLEVTGIVNAAMGDLITGNNLKLISDAVQTALIDGSGNGQVLGTVTMQRYLDSSFGYKYFSSPFSNSVVGDFGAFMDLTETFPTFYYYDENRQDSENRDATGWESYTGESNPIGVFQGYAINFGSATSPITVEISGEVNNGNQATSLISHNRTYTKGFNLIGNPYPSPIDWNASGWDKSGVDDAIYFFTAGNTNRYTGSYSSYVNGVQSVDGLSSSIIPSMQGFFVHVKDSPVDSYPVNHVLSATNQVRVNNFSQPFLKVAERESRPLIRLIANFENTISSDALVIYFDQLAKKEFQGDLDALKLFNTDSEIPNFYSISKDNKQLSINAISDFSQNNYEKIPLGIAIEKEGWAYIQLKDLKNVSSSLNVYLIDSEKRIGQNLSENPKYKFYSKSGENNKRFSLLFSYTPMTDPAIAFNEPFSVNTQSSTVVINMNLEHNEKGTIKVSTVTGQLIDVKPVQGNEPVEIEGIKSSGVYFITLTVNSETFSKKVLIRK